MLGASPAKQPTASSLSPIAEELRNYLESENTKAEGIFAWWHRNQTHYPKLWLMARDYCTIPGVKFDYSFHKGFH